jgi:hypothetical protein
VYGENSELSLFFPLLIVVKTGLLKAYLPLLVEAITEGGTFLPILFV